MRIFIPTNTDSLSANGFLRFLPVIVIHAALLLGFSLVSFADGPPPTPAESGHRLADLERYKQKGLDSYGNPLPTDPAQRQLKVNERDAKLSTERGKLFKQDGSRANNPLWTQAQQNQAYEAYLARQRHYLQADHDAAEKKAKDAGKTGRALRNDPDFKKARHALRANTDAWPRGVTPRRDAPTTTTTPSGGSSPGAFNVPSNGSTNVGLAMAGQAVKIKGTATLGSGQQMTRTKANLSTLVAGVMQRPILSAVGFDIYKGQNGFWVEGDELPPPVSQVGNDGTFSLDISEKYLAGYSDKITARFDYSSLGEDAAFRVGASYNLAVGYGFDAAHLKYDYGAFKSLQYSVTADVGINDNPSKIFGLRDGVSPWQIAEDAGHANLNLGGWIHQAMPFGTTLGWQPTGDPNVLEQFANSFGDKINYIENNAGNSGVPALSWNPANWIEKTARALPRVKLELKH